MKNYEKIQGLNGYRWKPSASQKAEYRERMKEKESLPTFTTNKAIRNGCIVEFYNVTKGQTIKGEVIKNSYGAKTNQHTFTILDQYGDKHLVKGRNLYPNIISHVQGEDSKKLNKPNLEKIKKYKLAVKRDGIWLDKSPNINMSKKEATDLLKKLNRDSVSGDYKIVEQKLNKPNLQKMKTKKTCTNRVVCEGLGSDGKLKKGYTFQKGTNNVIKKTAPKKKTPSTAKRKPSAKKKSGIFGLGILGIF